MKNLDQYNRFLVEVYRLFVTVFTTVHHLIHSESINYIYLMIILILSLNLKCYLPRNNLQVRRLKFSKHFPFLVP
jgi:hypothetical protein